MNSFDTNLKSLNNWNGGIRMPFQCNYCWRLGNIMLRYRISFIFGAALPREKEANEMPLKGFLRNDANGEQVKVSLEDAVKNPQWFNLPVVILVGIIKSTQYRGDSISATTLTGCQRRTYWERTEDFYVAPQDLAYKAFRGQMIHTILESLVQQPVQMPGEEGVNIELAIRKAMLSFIPEMRFRRTMDLGDGSTVEVSGQLDLLEIVANANACKPMVIIHDYKTAEPYAVTKIAKEGLDADHVYQVNFYRWIVDPYYTVIGAVLNYIGYGFTAMSGSLAKFRRMGRDYQVEMPGVPLWSEEDFLAKTVPMVRTMRSAFIDRVIPPADGGIGGWRCHSCPFKSHCDAYKAPEPKLPKPKRTRKQKVIEEVLAHVAA